MGGAGGQSGSSPLPQPEPLPQRQPFQLLQKLLPGQALRGRGCGFQGHVCPASSFSRGARLDISGSIPAFPSSSGCQSSPFPSLLTKLTPSHYHLPRLTPNFTLNAPPPSMGASRCFPSHTNALPLQLDDNYTEQQYEQSHLSRNKD